MKKEGDKKKVKRTYEKPKLITIELVVEEVLGFGCKTLLPGPPQGGNPCVGGGCSLTTGS
ncbi:MAG: hypothetical protein GTO18_19435 [Anaerolineales bacterium]|nr:hypothetical protein [Anaerolineales bacterium]